MYAGLGSLPGAIIFFIGGGWGSARVVNRFGVKRALLGATALITLGSLLLTIISPHGTYLDVLPGFILFAIGGSIGMPALNIAAFAGTKPGEEGLASGLISTSMRIGFPLGLAMLLTVAGGAAGSAAIGASDPSASVAGAIVLGFRYALLAAAVLGIVGVLVALRLKEPEKPNQESSESNEMKLEELR